jgi:prepilin-type N-terminal cleavage/methylation domain-containing protein
MGRRGFTLVELLLVAVLGSFILMAIYGVLVTHQRTYTVHAANMQGQQTVRAGMDLLFGELREISPSGGDIVAMSATSITIRVMRAAGLVCDTVPKGGSGLVNNPYKVVSLGDTFRTGDSIWLFAEKSPETVEDDVWFRAAVEVRADNGVCQGLPGQALRFQGPTVHAADTPTIGSLARAYATYTYALGTYEERPYLTRKREPGGTAVPVVGPLTAGSGLLLEYLNAAGSATTTPSAVRQIVVTLRTQHDARDAAGNPVVDSLKTRINTRN